MRYLFILLWTLGSALVFFLLTQVVLAGYVYLNVSGRGSQSEVLQAATDFAVAHAGVIRGLDVIALLLGAASGASGAWRGRLPGTRRPT